jgi:glycosyltransferase involved in cell wall biosynthesis
MCDEIWTASEYNKNAILKAGVTKPIYIVPEAIIEQSSDVKPYLAVTNEVFSFYSLFEWTERKNPLALLECYWTEFSNNENVSLTIKTYVDNFRPEKKLEIENAISGLKKKLGLNNYAKVYLYTNLMDRHQIYRFHKTFDCFVSTHRGEGWGIPQMEAMMMEKPIISTGCGGIHDYLNKDVACIIDFDLIPLVGNSRNQQWYTPDQNWAEVNKDDFRKAMRFVYKDRDKAREMGKLARQFVLDKFEVSKVGKIMRKRLLEIEKKL